jgi:hypothetical protein
MAVRVIGDERNAYRAACKLKEWVFMNVVPGDEALWSTEILSKKSGTCVQNSILYAALARSVGIPTKLVLGIVYDSSAFGGHMWTESFVGEWTPIDPSYPGVTVSATRIKFDESDGSNLPQFLDKSAMRQITMVDIVDYESSGPPP